MILALVMAFVFAGAQLALADDWYIQAGPWTVHFVTDGTAGSSVSSDTQTVADLGESEPVTAIAPANWHFTQWTGTNSFETTTSNPVVVDDVSAEMTVTAHFAIDTYTVTALTSANGTITPTTQDVNHGSNSTSLTITPNTGYHFVSAADGSGPITTVAGSVAGTREYKFTNVTANKTITAVFALNTFTLTYTANTGGTIVGSATQVVNEHANGTEVTATPNAGYHFVSWSDDVMTADRTDTNVTANHTVSATFASDRPAAPYSVTWSPVRGGTLIQWAGSPGATGYQVWLGAAPDEPEDLGLSTLSTGRLLGTTGPSTCYLFVDDFLGPNASIYVVALRDEMSSLPGVGVYTAAVTPVKFGTVRFTGNSSRLTPATKRALRRYASLMATQGFTSVNVSGYTAKFDHGSSSFRKRLSVKRAKNVKAYLAAQFRALHVHVSINAAGYGGTRPVASNRTKAGAAKNRRAEVLLR